MPLRRSFVLREDVEAVIGGWQTLLRWSFVLVKSDCEVLVLDVFAVKGMSVLWASVS